MRRLILAALLLSSCIELAPGFRQVDGIAHVNDVPRGAVVIQFHAIGPFAEPDATD